MLDVASACLRPYGEAVSLGLAKPSSGNFRMHVANKDGLMSQSVCSPEQSPTALYAPCSALPSVPPLSRAVPQLMLEPAANP